MISRRQSLSLLAGGCLAGLSLPAWPSGPRLLTRDPFAQRILTEAANQAAFWQGAQVRTFQDRPYDEVRLKALDEGYLAMVTGEGGRDFQHDTVVRTVFENMTRLPQVEDGARAVVRLGGGTDAVSGVPFNDSFFFLDFTFFYGTYGKRMYKLQDGERTILYFERLTEAVVGADWARYQARMDEVSGSVKKRALMNAVVPVSEIFGMFIVEPGRTRRTRVSFTTRLRFGEGSMVARMGSEMPMVIRAGLQSGFQSCVQIAAQLEPA